MLYVNGYMWFNQGYTAVLVQVDNNVGAWHINEGLYEGVFISVLVSR